MGDLSITSVTPISLHFVLVNVVVGFISAFILSWHYLKYSNVISNKNSMQTVFYFVIMITTLVISIVKSSLALSLGLVGALSIVRFRTPIKEPEDLAYLFLCIAIGLGLGANQTVPTFVSLIAILTAVSVVKWTRSSVQEKALFLYIDLELEGEPGAEITKLKDVIAPYTDTADPQRMEVRDGKLFTTHLAKFDHENDMATLTSEIYRQFKNANVSLIDNTQDLNW